MKTETTPRTAFVATTAELSVVIPTYNERGNIPDVLAALEKVLAGIAWEVLFVDDDSPDGTADLIRQFALTTGRIRVLQRIGRRGLSSACIEGMLATSAPYLAVMDADLQHDESILPRMLERIKSESLDIVIASRQIPCGSMGEFSARRIWVSNLGTRIGRLVCHCEVSDAMSGFFLVRREYFQRVVRRLTGTGFKILIDLLASGEGAVRAGEVPYHFRKRQIGESKLDINVELEYLVMLLDKLIGNWVPVRFVLFLLVGSFGIVIHLAVLAALHYMTRIDFALSQAIATLVAMTTNFILNNVVTFRDRRLRKWRFVRGLLTFYVACSAGAFINIAFAKFLFRLDAPWYLAGISGMAVSAIWNYVVNVILTWRRSRATLGSRLVEAEGNCMEVQNGF